MPPRAKVQRTASRLPAVPVAVAESELDEELLLWRRLEELQGGNRYQRDFHAFLTECVWTVDDTGGEIAQFPDDPYNRESCGYLIEEPLTFWEKSRRVLMTWRVSALDLWLAAGGQDPRWPALMKGTGHRTVLIISKKEEDAAWVLSERVKFIYNNLYRGPLREVWPDFPMFTFSDSIKGTLATASNGSSIRALPQGEKQVHQYGGTFLHYEEVSLSEHAGETVAAAIPVMLGKGGSSGKICLICTPKVGTWARELREGKL